MQNLGLIPFRFKIIVYLSTQNLRIIMKKIAMILSVMVFGLSMSMANASDSHGGGNGQDNVMKSKTYQDFINK